MAALSLSADVVNFIADDGYSRNLILHQHHVDMVMWTELIEHAHARIIGGRCNII
jgi:hypothetical protein